MKIRIFLILFLTIILSSCEREYPCAPQSLVVEGWIENGKFPVVLVSLSGSVQDDGTQASDFVVRWAKVSIDDGENTYVMIGTPDTCYFPPYIYTSYELEGEVGKTYKLTVEYKDMVATAVTTIPEPVEIDTLLLGNTDNDSERSIKVLYTPDFDERSYYCLRYRDVYSREYHYYISFMGLSYADPMSGQLNVLLQRVKLQDNKAYTPYFFVGSKIDVRLSRMSKDGYDFWTSYDNVTNFDSMNAFVQSQVPIISNVEGGYGCWIGYGISEKSICVR